MDLLRRYRVGVVAAVLLVLAGGVALVWSRAQQARGATRTRPDALVGVVSPQRRDIEVKLSFTADILADPAGGDLLEGLGLHPEDPRRPG